MKKITKIEISNYHDFIESYDFEPNKGDDRIHYRIIQFPQIGNFLQDANHLDAIDFLDQQGTYQAIKNVIVW